MKLEQSAKKELPLRIGLQGLRESGKTYNALLLAYGLCGSYSKIALIDTEHHAAGRYAHLGPFQTLSLGAPFTTEKYISSIRLCEEADIEVIILDSISPEWQGEGGIIDRYCEAKGNKGQRYIEAMSYHYEFMDVLRNCSAHLIATLSCWEEYKEVLVGGRVVNERVERPLQEEGMEYFFTTLFHLDREHLATTVKDTTGLFSSKEPFVITPVDGAQLARWNKDGMPVVPLYLQQRIDACTTVEELITLLFSEDVDGLSLNAFKKKRRELENASYNTFSSSLNSGTNETINHLSAA